MKNLIFAAVIVLFSFTSNVEASSNIASRVGGYFYSSLSPHGTWIDIGYGAIAWKPTIMVRAWQPYNQGRWIWSDYGWYWYSYEPFGHIVYHYGRWYFDDYYGWIWIPDYEWAPAWVEWRYSDSYIGWAPLSPYGVFSVSIGIHFTRNYYVPYNNWHYVHINHFYSPYLTSYYVAPKYKYRIHSKTKHRTDYAYYNGRVRNNGIDVGFIEKRTGQKIRQTNIRTENDPRHVIYDKNRDISRDGLRTFYVDKNELSRENFRDIEVKRSDRKSSLDLSRVELGSTRDLDKERIRREMPMQDSRDVKTENNNREVVREQRDVKNDRRVTTERDNSNSDSRNTEVQRNQTPQVQQRNTEVQRNHTPQVQQRNTEVQRNQTPQVQQRNTEVQRNQTPQVQQRNTEVQRNQTQSKQETRTVEKPNQNSQRETRIENQRKNDSNNSSRQNDSNDKIKERRR